MKIPKNILDNLLPYGLLLLLPFLYLVYTYSKRITSISHLPRNFKNFTFTGLVVSVGDGDGFRAVHLPLLRPGMSFLKEDSLPIRLAGVDAPEVRSFGKPAQTFSKEAKLYLKNLIDGKKVKIQILDIDHFNRIVAMVFIKSGFFSWKNINLSMLDSGMACVFRSRYTSFGGLEEQFYSRESIAKSKKIGIWSDPNFINPQEYKRKMKSAGPI